MNMEYLKRSSGAVIGLIAVAVVFAVLSIAVKLSLNVPTLNADRSAARATALKELRAAEAAALNTAGWLDQQGGIVRLPVEKAIRATAARGADYAAFRAELISRAEAAAPKAPPPAPKSTDFE